MTIVKLRDHQHNLCRDSKRVSHARERLGIYSCRHGYLAALPEPDADGDGIGIADLFETEAAARAALASLETDR